MARNKCYRVERSPKAVRMPGSNYEPITGKDMTIWPPKCCYPETFSMEGDYKEWCSQPTRKYTEEELRCFHDLKYKYGFSGLFVWLGNIEASLQAGWKCSELILHLPHCWAMSCKEMIEYINCAMDMLHDSKTGLPREGCDNPTFKWVYLDEPRPPIHDSSGDIDADNCTPCDIRFLATMKHLIDQFGTKFIIGHYNLSAMRRYDRVSDEVTLSTYHTWFSSNQSGVDTDLGETLGGILNSIAGLVGLGHYTWADMVSTFGTSRFWISASTFTEAHNAPKSDPDRWGTLFRAAHVLKTKEIMIYAWEVPCEEWEDTIELLSSVAGAYKWLTPPKTRTVFEEKWYKCMYDPPLCHLCNPKHPREWIRVI